MWGQQFARLAAPAIPAAVCLLGTLTSGGGGGSSWAESSSSPKKEERSVPHHHRRETLHLVADSLGPPRIHRIVITGGPCAGKTTAMDKLSQRLSDMGFAVYIVPELATLTITGGANPASYERDEFVHWEAALLRAQMRLEDVFSEIAESCSGDRHSVLLCDRGTMDVLAYVGKETFDELCEENGWTVPALRDKRYNAVVHLVSAAIGARKFYTLENNKARMETLEEAIELDGKLSRAWVGHNSLHIIENSGSFEDKMVRCTAAVCDSLGVPGPRTVPRWWIVKQVADAEIDVEHAEWLLEHTFLSTRDGKESRVTKKSSNGNVVTYHHRASGAVVDGPPLRGSRVVSNGRNNNPAHLTGEQSVSERTLSYREYKALMQQADPSRTPIKKKRKAFIWDNEYYMLDSFILPLAAAGTTTLFVEKPVAGKTVESAHLPPFLELVEDVTSKHWFSSHAHDSWMRTKAFADDLSKEAGSQAGSPSMKKRSSRKGAL